MSFGSACLFFFVPLYASNSLMVYIAYLLAGRKMPYQRVFLLQIPAVLIQSVLYSANMVTYRLLSESSGIVASFFIGCFSRFWEITTLVSWVYFLFKYTDKKKNLFYASTVLPFGILGSYVNNLLLAVLVPDFTNVSSAETTYSLDLILTLLATFIFVHGAIAVIIRLISGTEFWGKLQALGSYPKVYIPIGLFYFLFFSIYGTLAELLEMPDRWLNLSMNLAYLVLLGLAALTVSDIKRTENLDAAQNLLLQQQSYINKLESLQQEIRSIQHDYKNMLSGLYVQASEGNAEAVKEYIDTKLLRVDKTVRENLSQMNQLTRIEIPELKGLIMTKMLEAERDKIPFRMEVMFPVRRALMAAEDLLRCVGILLDNAIEEAKTQKDAAVTLLLLQEDKTLTIVVKNPVQDKPNLTQIWNEGYSTKGSGKGVGLSNYKNIIRKYPNAVQETKVEGEHFVQVLVLTGKL